MSGERVTKSRRQAVASGRKRLSAILSTEGSERYARLKERHASEAALIEAALKSLEGANELTDAELIAALAQRLKSQGEKKDVTSVTGEVSPPTEQNPVKKNQTRNSVIAPPPRKP